jgi:calcineurin-like phosphoesterase family protein
MIAKKNFIVFIMLVICQSCFAEAMRFAVIADTQGELAQTSVSTERFSQIVDLVLAAEPKVEFVIQVGDLISGKLTPRSLYADWMHWRDIAKPWYESDFLGAKVYPIPGNHDQLSDAGAKDMWRYVFSDLPDNGPADDKYMTYSFEHGQCHLTGVNTSKASLRERHLVDNDWLEADLANSTKPVQFVFGHAPAYSSQHYIVSSLDTRPDERDRFWQILKENGVSAYFCGHEHNYDVWVKDNVFQFDCGTGGAEISPYIYLIVDVAEDNSVIVSVYNAHDNSLIDQFDLSDTTSVDNEDREDYINPIFTFIDTFPCVWAIILPALLLMAGLRLTHNDD